MARIKVPFKGVTSQSNHADGECKNIVNLRPERGYYKPVTPRKIVRNISGEYEIVFIHRGNGYANWIGVNDRYVYNINGAAPILLFEVPRMLRNDGVPYAVGNVTSIQQIGNTLSFITRDNIYYALWKDGSYVFLGDLPECPNVEFSTNESKAFLKFSDYDGGMLIPRQMETESLNTRIKGVSAKRLSELNGSIGSFTDGFMIRWAFRLYDGSTVKVSSPILVMPQSKYTNWGRVYLEYVDDSSNWGLNSGFEINAYRLNLSYDLSFLEAWSDIITSVDYFISPYTGFASIDNIYELPDLINGYPVDGVNYPLFYSIDAAEQLMEKVEGLSNFYLYYSDDDFSGSRSVTLPNSNVTVKDEIQNIIYQEQLENDTLSHHKYGADSAYVYNNRLRLMGLKTTFFNGFHLNHFAWGSNYNGVDHVTETKLLYVNVKIRLPEGEKVVQIHSDAKLFLNAFISYPDPRAFELEVYQMVQDPGTYRYPKLLSIKLKPHPTLNIAYWINGDLEPVRFISESSTFSDPYITNKSSIVEKNKIKVSEINNPFVFPNANTYQVGSGEMLAESSIIMNVSDRNYGMYPIFVFTTDGVFTMAGQDAETVHASIQAPTYLEPPISNVICATPYGVVFITTRGLMQISNRSTEFLSQVLREDDEVLEIDLTGVEDDMLTYPVVSFRQDLKSIRSIVYNPYDDELIISVGAPYNYVYDYETRSFYLSTNLIGQLVQNSFPDIYYITDDKLIDISQQESKATQVSVLTRPIQFETADIKKLDRIFLRGLMYNANNMSVAAYHSIDGVNYSPIKGFKFGSGANYKDYDLGMLARETYRQYIFLLTGTIDEESQLEYVEFEVDKNYNNDKMR